MIFRRLFMSRLRRRVLANLDLAMSGAGYEPSRRTATPERPIRSSRPVLPVSAPETGPEQGGVASPYKPMLCLEVAVSNPNAGVALCHLDRRHTGPHMPSPKFWEAV